MRDIHSSEGFPVPHFSELGIVRMRVCVSYKYSSSFLLLVPHGANRWESMWNDALLVDTRCIHPMNIEKAELS